MFVIYVCPVLCVVCFLGVFVVGLCFALFCFFCMGLIVCYCVCLFVFVFLLFLFCCVMCARCVCGVVAPRVCVVMQCLFASVLCLLCRLFVFVCLAFECSVFLVL